MLKDVGKDLLPGEDIEPEPDPIPSGDWYRIAIVEAQRHGSKDQEEAVLLCPTPNPADMSGCILVFEDGSIRHVE